MSDEDSESLEMVGYTGRTASGMIKQMLNLRSRSNSTVQGVDDDQSPLRNGALSPILGTPPHKPLSRQNLTKKAKSLPKINQRIQSEIFPQNDDMVLINKEVQLGSEGTV